MQVFESNKLYSQIEAAPILGKSIAWFERCRWAGEGPKFIKVGRNVRYLGNDLNEWLESRVRGSTSDKGDAQ
ncbi:helix-turn-helix domain-containing protein [Acidithiobacillus sp. CV18-2]|nr:helix-turn-helix domain-containing protein [Acidithiobacillus sp. CV18-3]MBU2757354.1 helix-turn-helix domain-containing protein [Acidithiobacillus sp. BN09-2]MBU2776067.1 helix-turn-helix domain-containing protein [Acidithiobacillus sp. CV18-2]MBU2800256.1 helix-turn-helix domain-containing protein [Acidithiobacillus sp. VAN18-4]